MAVCHNVYPAENYKGRHDEYPFTSVGSTNQSRKDENVHQYSTTHDNIAPKIISGSVLRKILFPSRNNPVPRPVFPKEKVHPRPTILSVHSDLIPKENSEYQPPVVYGHGINFSHQKQDSHSTDHFHEKDSDYGAPVHDTSVHETNNPPKGAGVGFNDAREKCADDGQAFYQGSCEYLLITGPCKKTEWLVLNDEGHAICQHRPCPYGSLYYGRCVEPTDPTICPRGQILYVDLHGNVDCDCDKDFWYDPSSGMCFAQHEQGFCAYKKHILVIGDTQLQCVNNDCENDYYVRFEARCYEKEYIGYCPPDRISINDAGRAECLTIQPFSIFGLPRLESCAAGSKKSYSGRCAKVFRLPAVSSEWAKGGRCRLGLKLDTRTNKVCRKSNSVFGES